MKSIDKQIFFTLFVLICVIIFFGLSDIDLTVQDKFFDFSTHRWILDSHTQPYKFIFYDGIKKLLILFALTVLLLFIVFFKTKFMQTYKRGMLVFILSAILVPVFVGGLKKWTNMPCPKDEIRYGGRYPRVAVWESYHDSKFSKSCIRCWPAGHASGGFALLSLFFLFKSRKMKIFSIILGLIVGWSMGLYKMVIGDHFLSHTLVTMILAWFIILIIARFLKFEISFTPPQK